MNKKILAGLTAGAMLCSNAFAAINFSDVAEGAWYYEFIEYVTENGIMNGMGDGTFAPSTTLSRAMIVQILYNFNKFEAPATTDIEIEGVDSSKWYYNAISWAVTNNLLVADENGEYRVEENATREEVIDLMYNFAKLINLDVSVGEDTNILSYNDAFDITEGKAAAFCWACGEGIITGDDNGNLKPTANITRAETATIMKKFDELLKKNFSEEVTEEAPVEEETTEEEQEAPVEEPVTEEGQEAPVEGETTEEEQEAPVEEPIVEEGQEVVENEENSFIISLEGNATTGYSWEAISYDVEVINVMEGEYVVDDHEEGLVGVPGVFNFEVKGMKEGSTELTFAYYRSFEGLESTVEQVTYKVDVDENGNVSAEKISESKI